jgi:hypothetical protein
MPSDSINDEIRGIRHDLAAPFGNDLDLILADIRKREVSDGRTYVSLSPRAASRRPDEQSDARERENVVRDG